MDIRGTITKLKSDIMDLDLRTGVASAGLWRSQKQLTASKSKKKTQTRVKV